MNISLTIGALLRLPQLDRELNQQSELYKNNLKIYKNFKVRYELNRESTPERREKGVKTSKLGMNEIEDPRQKDVEKGVKTLKLGMNEIEHPRQKDVKKMCRGIFKPVQKFTFSVCNRENEEQVSC